MWIIGYAEIFSLFALKLTYKSQALLIDKILRFYKEEATDAIDFAIKINAIKMTQRK